jgi:hypothetical protein
MFARRSALQGEPPWARDNDAAVAAAPAHPFADPPLALLRCARGYFAMNALRLYLRDFLNSARRVGGVVGVLLMLLTVPGIIAPALKSDWARGLPWLPVGLAVVSGVLSILGLGLLLYGIRGALRFGPRPRIRTRR